MRTREPAQTGGALLATMGGGGDATTTLDEADAALPVTVGGDDEQLRGVASTAARLSSRPYALTDKSALPLDVSSKALDDRCQQHVDDVLRRAAVGEPAPLMADALENVRIAPTNGSADEPSKPGGEPAAQRFMLHLLAENLDYVLEALGPVS